MSALPAANRFASGGSRCGNPLVRENTTPTTIAAPMAAAPLSSTRRVEPGPTVPAVRNGLSTNRQESDPAANVLHSIEEIMERSSILRSLYREGKIGIVGGMYNLENGRVHFIRKMFAEQPISSVGLFA